MSPHHGNCAVPASSPPARESKKRKRRHKPASPRTPPPLPPLLRAAPLIEPISSTRVASLGDDVVAEILVRLPSEATLARAALACRHWRRVASTEDFFRRFRALHPPPPLLGHFLCQEYSSIPLFLPLARVRSDRDLAAAVRGGDFHFTGIEEEEGSKWCLQDCLYGRLLFSSNNNFTVYDPVSRRGVSIRRPSWKPVPDSNFTDCLLPGRRGGGGDGSASFRVLTVQHHDNSARAAVYDSRAGEWRLHRWVGKVKKPQQSHETSYFPAMQVAGRIYWKHRYGNLMVSLDTRTMSFSRVDLPEGVYGRSRYAVGETEDGACCLVGLVNPPIGPQFKVWLRKGSRWELDKVVPKDAVLHPCSNRVRQVRAVVGGVVLVCMDHHSGYYPHCAFRLRDLRVEAEFACREWAYPYLMPWPSFAFSCSGA